MDEEKQRIAIAEHCLPSPIHALIDGWWDGDGFVVPDYLNDLNACHTMEKTLTESQGHTYKFKLHGFKSIQVGLNSWHATAKQRCEAYLKTIGKWQH